MTDHTDTTVRDDPAGIVAIAALFFFSGMAVLLPLVFWASTLS